MFIMYFMVLGIAAFGGNFIKMNIAGVSFTYITMAALCFSYFRYIIIKCGKIPLDKITKSLIIFELYGLLMVLFSILGINKFFISSDLYINTKYIPRQSYYLIVLPALILMKEEAYMIPLKKNIYKYGDFFFYLIYIVQILYNQKFCISVSTTLVLAGLALYNGGGKKNITNLIKFVIIILTPIAVGGELTNIIIRLIYLVIFLFINSKKQVIKLMFLGLIFMIAFIYILPFFMPLFEKIFDANTFWRLKYWNDELYQVIQSKLLGVGYGTSYATENFVGRVGSVIGGPFGASNEYSALDKLFVVGPHNSYIAILFRLGLIGILMFLRVIFNIGNLIKKYYRNILPASIFLFFSSIVLIGVNVGLESPYYLLIFVFSIGNVIFDIKLCKNNDAKGNFVIRRKNEFGYREYFI